MAHYFARPRRNRGAWYEALQIDQARTTGATLEEIRDFDEEVAHSPFEGALIAADSPAPARGYLLIAMLSPATRDEEPAAYARAHVLDGQPDDVYRALFSQARARVDGMTRRGASDQATPILVDVETLAEHVLDAVGRLGEAYAVYANVAGMPSSVDAPTDAVHALDDTGDVQPVQSVTEPLQRSEGDTEGTEGTDTQDTTDDVADTTTPTPDTNPAQVDTTPPEVDGNPEKPEKSETGKDTEADTAPVVETPEPVADAPTPVAPQGDTYDCPEFGCGKTFGTQRGLTAHGKTHTK